jgi:hypothetical protein
MELIERRDKDEEDCAPLQQKKEKVFGTANIYHLKLF